MIKAPFTPDNNKKEIKICFIGNYPPKQCGIATFTSDLCDATENNLIESSCKVIALNTDEKLNYSKKVIFEITKNQALDYYLAAEYINHSQADIICLQHEFGIFGGETGNYILKLIANLKKPLVTTLHTINPDLQHKYQRTFFEILNKSQALVVMSQQAQKILIQNYNIEKEKTFLIYHGTPDVDFIPSAYYKEKTKLNLKDKFVILTFGLINKNKGFEYMLAALPEIIQKYPEVVYVIAGSTHPEVKKREGDKYLNELKEKTKELGIEKNIIFYNKFLSFDCLCNFIGIADVFATPYLSPEQIVSGTLSYAIAMGKAIISTPYWYAQEMLKNNRGKLVDFKNPKQLAKAILGFVENPQLLYETQKNAYKFGRKMVWNEVGKKYVELFKKILKKSSLKVTEISPF